MKQLLMPDAFASYCRSPSPASSMPRSRQGCPASLELQCIYVYLRYLLAEMRLIHSLKCFQGTSLLIRQCNLAPDSLIQTLHDQLTQNLKGIVQGLVRQKMLDLLIPALHQDLFGHEATGRWLPWDRCTAGSGHCAGHSQCSAKTCLLQPKPLAHLSEGSWSLSQLPIFLLFNLLLHPDLRSLDFSQNREWPETDEVLDISRALWELISAKCPGLERLIVPKGLVYSHALNKVISQATHLTHLTLKRNVPSNMFLSIVGKSCANLQELDIAGADIVTDFGVVCLLFEDPEQIFLHCWNRDKTVGSNRKSFRSLPQPHFDKPIPDPAELPPEVVPCSQYLHLSKSFHEAIRQRRWPNLPICRSLIKLRLENTKIKADGASVALECCPNLYSLGYLVFVAAGLKQVFGTDGHHFTKFTEIFYRGPSEQKLQTIANCCPNLKTLFLGSNTVRKLNPELFIEWRHLQYLTMENISADDLLLCLEHAGRQLKGLKLLCSSLDLSHIGANCPNLQNLIIQKETSVSPFFAFSKSGNTKAFGRLLHLEISCAIPSKCFSFLIEQSALLQSVKVLHIPGITRQDLTKWVDLLPHLETLIIFVAPEINLDLADLIIESLPSLRMLGNFHSFNIKPSEMKRLSSKIKDHRWDIHLLQTPHTDFNKVMTLHWFYLTSQTS